MKYRSFLMLNIFLVIILSFVACKTTDSSTSSVSSVKLDGSRGSLIELKKINESGSIGSFILSSTKQGGIGSIEFSKPSLKEFHSRRLKVDKKDLLIQNLTKQVVNFSKVFPPARNSNAYKKFEIFVPTKPLTYTHAIVIRSANLSVKNETKRKTTTIYSSVDHIDYCVLTVNIDVYNAKGDLVGAYEGSSQKKCGSDSNRYQRELTISDWPSFDSAYESAISKIDTF